MLDIKGDGLAGCRICNRSCEDVVGLLWSSLVYVNDDNVVLARNSLHEVSVSGPCDWILNAFDCNDIKDFIVAWCACLWIALRTLVEHDLEVGLCRFKSGNLFNGRCGNFALHGCA